MAAASSAVPSSRSATVRTMGGSQLPSGAASDASPPAEPVVRVVVRRTRGHRSAQLEHPLEIAHGAVRALAVRLVHREHVRDLEHAGLDRLHVVAEPGHRDDDDRVREVRDLDLVLADADRLDEDDVLPHRVEHLHDVRGRAREAAEVAARAERADEDARDRSRGPASGCGRRGSRRR